VFKIEESLRLPTFQCDVPIVLGNGEAFHFRPPRFVTYPEFDQDGKIIKCTGLNYGPDWEAHFEAATQKEERKEDIYEDVVWFADTMLRRNYKEEIRKYYKSLIYINNTERDSIRRMFQIWDVARGFDPKGLSSDGSAQPWR
jgi:hypothetical protein